MEWKEQTCREQRVIDTAEKDSRHTEKTSERETEIQRERERERERENRHRNIRLTERTDR